MNPVHLLLVAAGACLVAAGFVICVPLGLLAASVVLCAAWWLLGDS